jgi:phosphoesterase RecJ-like protein
VFERLACELRKARHVLLTTHECPDGDGIGSCLGLRLALQQLGIMAETVTVGPVPANFRFLAGAEMILSWNELAAPERSALFVRCDLAFVLDTHALGMLGSLGDALARTQLTTLFLDHHPPQEPHGERIFCDPQVSSTGELAWGLFQALGEPLSPEAATCLYAAITYDTNSFKYLRGRAETHAVAAELVRLGADTDAIYRHVFASGEPGRVQLLGEILRNCHFASHGKLAWVQIPRALTAQTQVARDDLRDAITHLLEIDGVEIAASFLELDPASCRLSLRSLGRYPVGTIAQRLGGGGHRLAAGAQLMMPVEEATQRVLAMLEELLTTPQGPAGQG